jgi:hypothetical protein
VRGVRVAFCGARSKSPGMRRSEKSRYSDSEWCAREIARVSNNGFYAKRFSGFNAARAVAVKGWKRKDSWPLIGTPMLFTGGEESTRLAPRSQR